MRRIGIFGGSFDPLHNGHLKVAQAALSECALDEVWLMVSPENPLKAGRLHAPEADRLAMARLAVAEESLKSGGRIKVSDFEFSLPRPSYTVNTLRALKASHPEDEFIWIAGGDSLESLAKWREPDVIVRDFGLIIYPRPGSALPEEIPAGVAVLEDIQMIDVSSTRIREILRRGETLKDLELPAEVAEYISVHPELYA